MQFMRECPGILQLEFPGYENKNLRVHIKPKGTITCKDGNYSVLIQYNDYQTRAISLEVYNKLNDRDSLLIGVKYYKILQLSDPVIYLSSKCKGQISCGELKFSNFIGAIQPADIMTGFRAKVTQYRALLITNNQGVQYFEAYSSKIPSPMKISMQNLSAGDKIIFFDVYCAFYRNSDFLFERKTDESLELTIKD